MKEPISCAVSIHHRLAKKDALSEQDLYDESLMIIRRGWNSYVDMFRDDIEKRCPRITVIDFDFYSTGVFNQCENSNNILTAIGAWKNDHPLLKILPVDWQYVVPTGLLYSSAPSENVRNFVNAMARIYELEYSI